ncbi:MAG: fibro-slime domain-containing protein [Myxococcales bacterium]|nr:fibro-slime domain-containing protein [Myxococcales bacterium]
MKTNLLISYTAALLLVGCGRTPAEGDATASATDSATDATGTADTTATSGAGGSMSDSQSPTDTGGSVSVSQSDTGETTATATTAPITATDSDTTASLPGTDTSSPSDPSGDTSSSGESQSASDTDTGSSTGGDTSTGGDGTTTTGDDDTTTGDDASTGDVQCGLQLNVTIRDFQFSHPDMEDYCCGQVNGLVQNMLGPGNKPVFANAGNPKMLTDAPTFAQWYTDVPQVNQKTTIVIDLQEIMPGVYSYQSNSFFPVDNMLFGNEGQAHNYHFTTEIHTQFQYNGGEVFTFSGDDDVWVFVNKQLAIDIGGVHGPAQKSVNIDTLGLTIGQIYPLDVFHAERHTVDSNFRIDTTICSMPQ